MLTWLVPWLVAGLCAGLFIWLEPETTRLNLLEDHGPWEGLHEAEEDAKQQAFRWTKGQVAFYLPLSSTGAHEVTLRLQSGREGAEPLPVQVRTAQHSFSLAVAQQPRQYRMLVDYPLSSESPVLTLAAPTFQPESDPRQVGVVLHEVQAATLLPTTQWWRVTLLALGAQVLALQIIAWRMEPQPTRRMVLVSLWLVIQLPWLLTWGYQRWSWQIPIGVMVLIAGVLGARFIRTLLISKLSWAVSAMRYVKQFFVDTAKQSAPGIPTRWDRYDYALVTGMVAVAVVLRVLLLPQIVLNLNADDYLVGVFALNILEGDRPIYYESAGALPSYIVAPLLAITGPSLLVLLMYPMFMSVLLVVALYGLGRDLFGRWGGCTAGAWAMLPVATAILWTMKIQPYIDALALATLALWGTIHLMWSIELPSRPILLMAGIGIAATGALWANLVIVSLVATCGWVVLLNWRRLLHLPLTGYALMIGIPVIGWIWPLLNRMQEDPQNNPVATVIPSPSFQQAVDILEDLATKVMPQLLGILRPGGLPNVSGPVAVGLIAMIAIAIGIAILSLMVQYRRAITVPLVLVAISLLGYLVGQLGALLTHVRYVFPLYVAIPLLMGYLVSLLARLPVYGNAWASGVLAVMLLFHSVSTFSDAKMGLGYSPRHEVAITRELAAHNVKYGYMSYWLGMGVMFESGNQITASAALGPTRMTYDPRNEHRVSAAAGASTAFVFRTFGMSTPDFEAYLQKHDIRCTEVEVANYRLYLECTPFPDRADINWLREHLPESIE